MYIKYMMLVFSLFVVLGTSMHAQANEVDKASVQALVAKVKKAPSSQRRVLMNELKIKLRSMQQETRTQVMLGLRQSFNAQHTQMGTKQMQANMHHQNTMSMTEAKHMQEHMNMDSMKGQKPNGTNMPERPTVPMDNGLGNKPTMPQGPNGQTQGNKPPSNTGGQRPQNPNPPRQPIRQAPQGEKPNTSNPMRGR